MPMFRLYQQLKQGSSSHIPGSNVSVFPTPLQSKAWMFLCFQVLSTGLGRIVPNLISRKHTNNAATGAHIILQGGTWMGLFICWHWMVGNWQLGLYSLHYKLVWHLHVTEQHDNFLCQYCIHSLGCGCCTLLGELIPIAHHRRSLKRCDFMLWTYFFSVFCAFIPAHDHIIGTRLIVLCLIHLLLE
jgi:hypothetical protein